MKLHLPVILRKAVLACSAVVAGCTLYSGNMASAADIILTNTDALTIDYAETNSITNLEGGTLQLMGDTPLQLSNCGEGDGKVYTLFTGISQLTDKEGNALSTGNYTVVDYFDTTLPGTGFWAESTLQLTQDGTLQLVCHNEAVKAAQIITERRPNVTEYSYFEGIKFQDIYTTIENTSDGGAIEGDTVTLSNNGSVVFRENETSLNIRTIGGAICGPNGVTLENNGTVLFIKNTANSPTNVYGGAIFGDWPSTITLSNNENVTFSENTAASLDGVAFGGAIEGDTILINNNGSVSFGQNKANSLSLLDYNDSEGGAIRGRTITLNNNNSVIFSGNTASCNSGRALGGAILGLGPLLTLCGNNDLTFSRNTVSSNGKEALGGAIHTYYNNLSIQNNGSVLFEKNTEINNGTYRLRSIYTSGTGNVISLSAAEGKSIEFRDSVYINTGSTVSFNADYTDTAGIIHQQAGDIIFTGATTEADLLIVKDSAGTATEIENSRTTEVLTMTNLYGGRLRVEDGAIYKGYGITAMANSGSTVSVRNATLRHSGYDLLFNNGTTLELQGCNTITGNLNMLDGSTLHVDFTGNDSVTGLGNSNLTLSGDMQLLLTGAGNGDGKTYILFTDIAQLLDKEGNVLTAGNYTVGDYFDTTRPGTGFWADATLQLTQDGTLQLVMHNEAVKDALNVTTHQIAPVDYSYYKEVSFNDISYSEKGGAIFGQESTLLSFNGSVSFIENETSSGDSATYGGAIYGAESIKLSNNGNVLFKGNKAIADWRSDYAYGGAIYGEKNSTITLSHNERVNFVENEVSSLFYSTYGGAIYGDTIALNNNGKVVFEGNTGTSSDCAYGGAIYGGTITLNNNGSVEFARNGITPLHTNNNYAFGGAIFSVGNLSIQNNDYVLFEKNAEITSGGGYRLRSIVTTGGGNVISLSAAAGKSIEFRDSIYIRGGSTFRLNADYTYQNEQGSSVTVQQQGDIIFTGATTEEDLFYAKGNVAGTDEEVLASRTTEVTTVAHLYNGRLVIKEGAIWSGDGITVAPAEGTTYRPALLLQNAHLTHYKPSDSAHNVVTIKSGATFEVAGKNTASYTSLIPEDGSTLIFNISAANSSADKAVLCMSESSLTLPQSGTVTLRLVVDDGLVDGQSYALISGVNQPNGWNNEQITLSGGTSGWNITMDNLQWVDDTLWLYYGSHPELKTATWTNETFDGIWNTSSANWEQSGIDYAYKDGVAVIFGDAGAGKVTLEGILAPSSVLVNSREDYRFEGAGSLTGGMSLTKQGSGTLTITTNNSYTGGTTIEGGRLEVGHANALGTGTITLNGGTLDLNSYAVGNDIFATGGTLEGGDNFGGKLTVNGDLTLGGETTAGGGILLQGGSISGGSIVDTDITVNGSGDMEISSDIRGNSSLTLNNGDLTISGSNNNYTGGTIINKGNLTIGSGSSLGTGDITLNGGTLNTNGQEITNNIVNNGGTLISSYVLGEGHTLTVGKGGMSVVGNLTLAGGKLHFKGMPLRVDGEVTSTAPIDVLVSGYSVIDKEGTIHLADFGDNTVGMTAASFNNIGYGSLSYDEAKNTLSITLTNRNIWVGGKGATWIQGTNVGWANGETFAVGNRAVFNTKATVTITGAVEPASALVDVDKSLTFKTSYSKKTGLYSGSIVGNGCIVKRGSGKLTMNDGNTYSGGTFIEAGTVNTKGVMSFGSGTITLSGGTLNLASKAVANDIVLTDFAMIKGGKKFLGSYTQIGGELMKGSVLNIEESATISGGVLNGSLSGVGTVTVTGEAVIGTKAKVKTNGLDISGTLTVSSKGLAMNTKTSAITVSTGGELLSEGQLKAADMEVDGGLVELHSTKASSIAITNNMNLINGADMTVYAKVKTANLTMADSQLHLGIPNSHAWAVRPTGGGSISPIPLSLSVSGSLKLTASALTLSGKIKAGNLEITDSYVNMTSGKLQTIAVKDTLTLTGDNSFIFDFDASNGKSYKLFTFKDFKSDGSALHELLGWENNGSYILKANAKDITLTVVNASAWEAYMDTLAYGGDIASTSGDGELVASAGVESAAFVLARPATEVDPMLGKVADTLVQSTWGTAGASRAFGDTIAARGTHATALANGKGAAWISTMGGSSRISTDGGHAGADYTLTGAAFGMEARLSEKSTVGLAIGNSWGKVSTFSAFPVDQDSTHQGIYGKHLLGSSTTLSWMAAHTRTESDAKLAGMACDWTQDALQLDARVDKLFAISDRTTVSAFVGMQYLATDKGECNGLSTGSLQNLRGEIGVSAAHKATDKAYVYGELSFIGDMVRNNPTATVGDYRSRGANPGRAGLNLSVGASYQLNDSWSLNGSYSLELMQNQTSHSANVGATYSF